MVLDKIHQEFDFLDLWSTRIDTSKTAETNKTQNEFR